MRLFCPSKMFFLFFSVFIKFGASVMLCMIGDAVIKIIFKISVIKETVVHFLHIHSSLF